MLKTRGRPAIRLIVVVWSLVGWVHAADEGTEQGSPPPTPHYWRDQDARWHVASEVSAGVPTQALITGAYGKPHWMWGGIQSDVMLAPGFVAPSAGARFQLLLLNGYFGVRRTLPFNRTVATPRSEYRQADLLDEAQPRSNYTSLDAQLSGLVPIGPTVFFWGARGIHVLDFPQGEAIFSETFRTVLEDDLALLPHAAWFLLFMDKTLRVGPAADAVFTKSRDPLVRVGGGVSYQLSTHLSTQALLTTHVATPDPELGRVRQIWGVVRVRWTWASEEPSPGLL